VVSYRNGRCPCRPHAPHLLGRFSPVVLHRVPAPSAVSLTGISIVLSTDGNASVCRCIRSPCGNNLRESCRLSHLWAMLDLRKVISVQSGGFSLEGGGGYIFQSFAGIYLRLVRRGRGLLFGAQQALLTHCTRVTSVANVGAFRGAGDNSSPAMCVNSDVLLLDVLSISMSTVPAPPLCQRQILPFYVVTISLTTFHVKTHHC
jgi:hypothetical protein